MMRSEKSPRSFPMFGKRKMKCMNVFLVNRVDNEHTAIQIRSRFAL